MGFDLVIRGATVVTSGHREAAHIGIAGGRIAQLGGTMTGAEELAAGGLLAIPGGVDAHTHMAHRGLGDRLGFPIWVDDFWSGSRAAIPGGITTIGNMTYPVPDEEGTEETPGAAITREMAGAAAEAAVDWFLHPILLHPAALAAGEVAALAERGHASIKMFLADPDLAACEPALLAAASAAKAVGSVTLLHCEDGAMLRQAGEKLDPALTVVTARQGVADLETLMPMLHSEGVAAGRISLDRFVALTSANAARIFGLYPRKGAIAVGSDADIALWDPEHRRTIDGARMQSLSGYSVYDGCQVQGWPRLVLRRGQFVLADGEITARPGDGEWLRRNRTAGVLPPGPLQRDDPVELLQLGRRVAAVAGLRVHSGGWSRPISS